MTTISLEHRLRLTDSGFEWNKLFLEVYFTDNFWVENNFGHQLHFRPFIQTWARTAAVSTTPLVAEGDRTFTVKVKLLNTCQRSSHQRGLFNVSNHFSRHTHKSQLVRFHLSFSFVLIHHCLLFIYSSMFSDSSWYTYYTHYYSTYIIYTAKQTDSYSLHHHSQFTPFWNEVNPHFTLWGHMMYVYAAYHFFSFRAPSLISVWTHFAFLKLPCSALAAIIKEYWTHILQVDRNITPDEC